MPTAYEIYTQLLSAYGTPEWWSDDPFTVMVQAVLVQNTAWENVVMATKAMGGIPRPETILLMADEELHALIRPCGFFRAKARTIRSLAAWWNGIRGDESSLSTEELRKQLLAIKGVGEETADVILVYALYRPSFIIDAYTRRFLERIGYHFKNDEERRSFLTASLEKDVFIYGSFHWLLLEHSIMHCLKKPKCSGCVFSQLCRFEKSS